MGTVGVKKVTQEEKELIERMLKSGCSTDQIVEKTGRSSVTVGRVRKELKLKGFNIWNRGSAIAESIPVANTGVETSEAAEPEKTSGSFISVVKKISKLQGVKTNYLYILSSEADTITIRDGQYVWLLECDRIDGLIEELTGIKDEVTRFRALL